MKMSKAKLWAQNRNFGKFRLEGTISNIRNMTEGKDCILTEEERGVLLNAVVDLGRVLIAWKGNNSESKRLHLK